MLWDARAGSSFLGRLPAEIIGLQSRYRNDVSAQLLMPQLRAITIRKVCEKCGLLHLTAIDIAKKLFNIGAFSRRSAFLGPAPPLSTESALASHSSR